MKSSHKLIVIGLLSFAGVASVSYFVLSNKIQERKLEHIKELVTENSTDQNNIADRWQWDNFSKKDVNDAIKKAEQASKEKDTDKKEDDQPFEFDVVVVYSALGTVGIDDGGDVIVDGKALDALENAFAKLPDDLSESELEELVGLIKTGLPGAAGEQTADIVSRFQSYKLAERDFNQVMAEPTNVEEALALFDKKVALRESILGYDVANKLFSQEQAQSRHMLQLMAINSDKSLSEEEKTAKVEALKTDKAFLDNYSMQNPRDHEMVEENVLMMRRQGYSESIIDEYRQEHLGSDKAAKILAEETQEKQQQKIWEGRYSQFLEDKKAILALNLSEQDERQQIDALLRQHYDGTELEEAREYDRSQGILIDDE